MTPQENFRKALLRGLAASPFASTDAAPLIFIRGGVRTPLPGCVVEVDDNKADTEEWGTDRVVKISAQIPKALLPIKPKVDLDAVEYQGRQYNLVLSDGDEAHSPVWVIEGSSPFKA